MLREYLNNMNDQDLKKVFDKLREQDAKWRRIRPNKPPTITPPLPTPFKSGGPNYLRPVKPNGTSQNLPTIPTPVPTPSYSPAPPHQTLGPSFQGVPSGGVQIYLHPDGVWRPYRYIPLPKNFNPWQPY